MSDYWEQAKIDIARLQKRIGAYLRVVKAFPDLLRVVGKLKIDGEISGDYFKDEDDMASDSAVSVASQQSIKKYVDDNAGGGDASDITYTVFNAADWDGDGDPGNVDDALDQLAERVDDNEIAIAAKPSALDDLSDVNEGTPSDGDVLTYDGTASEWISEAPSGGSGGADILEVQVFT